jgi:hypothetical protein
MTWSSVIISSTPDVAVGHSVGSSWINFIFFTLNAVILTLGVQSLVFENGAYHANGATEAPVDCGTVAVPS